MEQVHLYSLEELVGNAEGIYAHTPSKQQEDTEEKKKETLSEHIELTKKYLLKLVEEKGIGGIADRIISNLKMDGHFLDQELTTLIKEMFFNAVILHDIGKVNPAFQKKKMKNPLFSECRYDRSDHSLLSALIYIDVFYPKIAGRETSRERFFLYYLLFSFAYCISRHHGYLKNTDEWVGNLKEIQKYFLRMKDILPYQSETLFEKKHLIGKYEKFEHYNYCGVDEIDFYILNKLLYSLIVGCDFYASSEYFSGSPAQFGLIQDASRLYRQYTSTEVYKKIEEYKQNKKGFKGDKINALRSELFLESEENLLNEKDSSIFFLEAPTGSGKTNTSINLALNLIKHHAASNKIFYIFPFNTLVEQTYNTFKEIFDAEDLAVVNSVTPILTREEERDNNQEDINYEKSLLDRQFLHYPVVITTHVNLFNYLFGMGRESNFPITQLCNSVIILDEIQSYRNAIWREIILFIERYADRLNIKVIIMSATLPRLDKLLFERKQFASLVKHREVYFQDPVFKNRVKVDFGLLSKGRIQLEDVEAKLNEIIAQRPKVKVLVEFIKKSTAREFYNRIKGRDGYPKVIELTGDDNKYTRDQSIKEIKASDAIIVVSTQVIEAGVDIDMDIGLKDISLLDSEEQFMGRINRSCNHPQDHCIAYFFDLDRAVDIYREDLRKSIDLLDDQARKALQEKDFEEFYDQCFEKIKEKNAQYDKNSNINEFFQYCLNLDFKNLAHRMKLITQKTYQIYLAYTMQTDKGRIDGRECWNTYVQLCQDKSIPYAKKQVKLSKLRETMSYFTYNLIAYNEDCKPGFFNEEFGGYFYIEQGEEYIFEDGEGNYKFDRKKFEEASGGMFL